MDTEQKLIELMDNLDSEEMYIKPVLTISLYMVLLYAISNMIIPNNYFVLVCINSLMGILIEDMFTIKLFSFSWMCCWFYVFLVNFMLLYDFK